MPTFNGEAHLRRALDSIVDEADAGVEVVAVDDGSSDGTFDILQAYQGTLNLTIERHPVGNWVSNTNLALGRATADLTCFLHQDDCWLPGRLQAVRKQMAETPSAGLLLHACRFAGLDGRATGAWRCPLPPRRPLMPAATTERLLVQNFVGIPGAVFRRGLALGCGGLDESLWYTADWDFWLKLAASADTVYLPRPFAMFRLHQGSQTATRSRSLDEFRRQMSTVHERHFANWTAPNAATRASVERTARAAIEVNVALAGGYHGVPVEGRRVLASLGALRLSDWWRLARDSRLHERVIARLRAGLRRAPHP
jgi:glycosyltransferase involved in cell wall biosynthesis